MEPRVFLNGSWKGQGCGWLLRMSYSRPTLYNFVSPNKLERLPRGGLAFVAGGGFPNVSRSTGACRGRQVMEHEEFLRERLLVLVILFLFGSLSACALGQIRSTAEGLNADQLQKIGALTDDEAWTASHLPKRQPRAIRAHLYGSDSTELVVAGIVSIARAETGPPEDLKGFVKILYWDSAGALEPLWRAEFSGVQYLGDIQKIRLDRTTDDQIFLRFDAVSNYAWGLNIVVFGTSQGHAWLSFPTGRGRAELQDLDGDGVDELISHDTLNVDAPAPQRVLWYDVYSWTGLGFVNTSIKFPKFYKDKIAHYQSELERERQRKTPEDYLRGYKAAIERAQGLLTGNR